MEPRGRDSANNYNENSQSQYNAALESLALLPSSFPGKSITVADYGSCEGRNSLILIAKFLSRLSNVDTANIILNDTPRNDFAVLGSTIEEQKDNVSGGGRLRTFLSMVPRSFYEQVVPGASVDVGICTSALHWLRPETPGVGHRYLPPRADARRAARDDLVAFLDARAREVKPGGVVVLGVIGSDGDGDGGDGPSSISLAPIFACMMQVHADMEAAGEMSADMTAELEGPIYFRTLDEVVAAVKTTSAWAVEETACNDVPLPVDAAFRAKWGDVDGAAAAAPEEAYRAYAEQVCDFLTASAANTIHAAASRGGVRDTAAMLARMKERFCQSFRAYGRGRPLGSTYIYVRLQRQ